MKTKKWLRPKNAKLMLILIAAILSLILIELYLPKPNPDNLDISCTTDADCRLEVPAALMKCERCDPYGCQFYNAESSEVVAVNKQWKPNCPPRNLGQMCVLCIGGIRENGYEAKCLNNQCIKAKK